MRKATITSKGRLTTPKQVRDRLGLQPGDRVAFDIEGGDIRLRVEKRRTLEEFPGSLSAGLLYPGREGERDSARSYVIGKHSKQAPLPPGKTFGN
ncbi:MAG: AbrB/MazE/SpoVT family DNA-binding domain-containing protein [Rubrobacter sp.]|nr:AbrB/MazE/SpoVT family DNA-binding domain-containing protein [Rubrobacter sp.]